MAKINHEEHEILKGLDEEWKWIARDSAGLDSEKLYSYSEKPYKDYGTKVWSTDDNRAFLVDNHLFQFIQWEDSEPYSIAELIREYESEETEVKKDIEFSEELQEPIMRAFDVEATSKTIEALTGMTLEQIAEEAINGGIMPKQEEVDRAYKEGYEKGKQHTFYKGYLEGITDKGSEPETVADVVTTFWKSYERLKEVMSMEVEELEE